MATQTETAEQTCSECGMPKSEWKGNAGKGVRKDQEMFCCEGCAAGDECTCS